MTDDVLLAYCTCPDAAVARSHRRDPGRRGAGGLRELPAGGDVCLSSGRERSRRDTEVLLLIKTTAARLPELTERLRELHPYDAPGDHRRPDHRRPPRLP